MVRDAKQKADLIASATHRHECSERNACDVELLSVGGFSPLTGFMNKEVYDHVVDNMRCVRLRACIHACCTRCSARAESWRRALYNRLSWRRLPGSNLLFGLPVVLDTHQEDVKEGSRVRHYCFTCNCIQNPA